MSWPVANGEVIVTAWMKEITRECNFCQIRFFIPLYVPNICNKWLISQMPNICNILRKLFQDFFSNIFHDLPTLHQSLPFITQLCTFGPLVVCLGLVATSACLSCCHYHHDDVIKWKQFPRYCPFVLGIHLSPVNSPHKGQWREALMFSLIGARINSWVNNRGAGDLRRHPAHCDVIVMITAAAPHPTLLTLSKNDFPPGHWHLYFWGI